MKPKHWFVFITLGLIWRFLKAKGLDYAEEFRTYEAAKYDVKVKNGGKPVTIGGRIPVVACGGLADGRGLAAGLMLGASGAMFGTRFYASQEAAGADAAKERIRAASGDDSLRSIVFDISRRNVWPAPFTGRCLRNGFLDRWYGREMELLRSADVEAERVAEARRRQNFDVAPVIAGEACGLVREILPAREIVEAIVHDAEILLARDYSRAGNAISS